VATPHCGCVLSLLCDLSRLKLKEGMPDIEGIPGIDSLCCIFARKPDALSKKLVLSLADDPGVGGVLWSPDESVVFKGLISFLNLNAFALPVL